MQFIYSVMVSEDSSATYVIFEAREMSFITGTKLQKEGSEMQKGQRLLNAVPISFY